jgi:hypothetical protein
MVEDMEHGRRSQDTRVRSQESKPSSLEVEPKQTGRHRSADIDEAESARQIIRKPPMPELRLLYRRPKNCLIRVLIADAAMGLFGGAVSASGSTLSIYLSSHGVYIRAA